MHVAVPNSHTVYSISEKLQKYPELREELVTIWQLETAYIIRLVLSARCIISNKLRDTLKLLSFCPDLYVPMKKAVDLILNT